MKYTPNPVLKSLDTNYSTNVIETRYAYCTNDALVIPFNEIAEMLSVGDTALLMDRVVQYTQDEISKELAREFISKSSSPKVRPIVSDAQLNELRSPYDILCSISTEYDVVVHINEGKLLFNEYEPTPKEYQHLFAGDVEQIKRICHKAKWKAGPQPNGDWHLELNESVVIPKSAETNSPDNTFSLDKGLNIVDHHDLLGRLSEFMTQLGISQVQQIKAQQFKGQQ